MTPMQVRLFSLFDHLPPLLNNCSPGCRYDQLRRGFGLRDSEQAVSQLFTIEDVYVNVTVLQTPQWIFSNSRAFTGSTTRVHRYPVTQKGVLLYIFPGIVC